MKTRAAQRYVRRAVIAAGVYLALASVATAGPSIAEEYLDAYFRMFPTRATADGRHDFDSALEDFSAKRRDQWVAFNRSTRERAAALLKRDDLPFEERLDCEALVAEIDRELHAQTVLRRPERDPLYWSGVIANATVFLLVRDDLPAAERMSRARARARLLPKFAQQAHENFSRAKLEEIAPELCKIAAGQLRASATFYRDGFPQAVGESPDTKAEGERAAAAVSELATLIDELGKNASGSPRLRSAYAETFRVGTGIDEAPADLLARATSDLAALRAEAAAYGRQVWPELLPDEGAPDDDIALLRRLFDRVEADRDSDMDAYASRWAESVRAIEAFVREKTIMTLPDPLTLKLDRSPSYFVGQSVGGVYASGPYAPEAKTILFLPAPANDATEAQRDTFFRAFNHHFTTMIVPHELIPGHYVQLKFAARHPHKIRAVFADPVYVEGWGTFCERLLLDQGWGGPLPRLAHLKKQLENIARTIVDIRVHTEEMSRDEVIRFTKEEALQDDQFASNMWTRILTSSPQITTYYLGYRKVREVFEAAQRARGERFQLREFMDGMMELGPVRLEHYMGRMQEAPQPAKPPR
jgi:uncharacterized protein (DUF885 family)